MGEDTKNNLESTESIQLFNKPAVRGSWEVILKDQAIIAPGSQKWSDDTFRILGYRPGEVLISNELFFRHVHPDDIALVETAFRNAIETCSDYDVEHRMIRKDGVEITVHEFATCEYYYGSERWVKVMGTVEDITVRKKAEQYGLNLLETLNGFAPGLQTTLKAGQKNDDLLPEPNAHEIREARQYPHGIRIPFQKDAELEKIYFPRMAEKLNQIQWHLVQCQRIARIGSWQIIIKDIDNIVPGSHQWSEETYRLLGYEPNEIEVTLDLFIKHIHPDDVDSVLAELRKAIATCSTYSIVHRVVRRDGTEIIVQEMGECEYYLGSKQWIKITGTAQDITDTKKAENYKAGLNSIFDNTSLAYTLLDTDLKIVSFNKAAYEGTMAEQGLGLVEGRSILDYTAPDRKESVRELYTSVVNCKKHSYELSFRQKDGQHHWYCVSLFPVLLDNVRVTGMAIAMEDITERKRAEEKIRVKTAKYRTFFESSIDALMLTERDGKILAANPAACSLFGMTEEEILAKGRQMIVDIDQPDFQALLERRQLTGSATGEVVFRRKDGSTFPGIISSTIFSAEDGREHTAVVIHDITERKEIEELREQKNRELITHLDQLNVAREEERTMIAREIHDELGQQLTALKMGIATVRDKLASNNLEDNLSSSLLSEIDEAIKSVRRIASSLRPIVLDNEGLIAALKWYASEFEKRHGIVCHTQLDDRLDVADKKISIILFRIMQESLTNVARHSKASQVEVNMSLSNGDIVLTISDDGIGIDTEQLKHKRTFGLTCMNERVKTVGGCFTITRNEPKGTLTRVVVPYHHKEYKEQAV